MNDMYEESYYTPTEPDPYLPTELDDPTPEYFAMLRGFFDRRSLPVLAVLHIIAYLCGFLVCIYASLTASYLTDNIYYANSDEMAVFFAAVIWIPLALVTIPLILKVIGYFVTYAQSRDTLSDRAPRAGLNLLFASSMTAVILDAVTVSALSVITVVGLFLEVPMLSSLPESLAVVLGILTVAVICTILLFAPTTRARWFVGIRKILRGRYPGYQGAKPYGSVSVLRAVLAAITLIGDVILLIALFIVARNPSESIESRSVLNNCVLPMLIFAAILLMLEMVIEILNTRLALNYRTRIEAFRLSHIPPRYSYGDGYSAEEEYYYPYGYGYPNAAPSPIADNEPPKYCPYCSARCKQSDKFCPECGNALFP